MNRITAKITSKAQITLPAKLRRRLGVKSGDRVDFVEGERGNIEILRHRKTLGELRGVVPYDGPSLSDKDIIRWVEEARTDRAEAILDSIEKLDRDRPRYECAAGWGAFRAIQATSSCVLLPLSAVVLAELVWC